MHIENYYKCVLAGLSATLLTACGNDADIVGKWVQPVPGLPMLQQGIVLKKGGNASSVNMATLLYETWQQKGDMLILTGKSIGNRQEFAFSDTLRIRKLTRDSLVLEKGKITLRYAKEKEQATVRPTESIPAAVLIPAKQTKVVKGKLVIAPEVRSFSPEGKNETYWIIDDTGKLYQTYDQITQGVKNGVPVYAELQVEDIGQSKEGFAANYDGVYKIHKVIAMRK